MRKAIWRYDIVCHVLASLREFSGVFSQETGTGGEIHITGAMIRLLKTQDVHA
jgi:hypothetical protein